MIDASLLTGPDNSQDKITEGKGGVGAFTSAPIFNLQTALDNPQVFSDLVINRDTEYQVVLGNGVTFGIEGRWLFFNLIYWEPLIRRNMVIDPERHVFYNKLFSNAERVRIHTNIFIDVRTQRPEEDPQLIKKDLQEAVTKFYNCIITYLNKFQRSISLFSIAETYASPEIQAVAPIQLGDVHKRGIKAVEDQYKRDCRSLLNVFSNPNIPNNTFAPWLRQGILNEGQFVQVLGACGPKTDVDDSMINLPVSGNYIDGLKNIMEYAVDSLSAKKSVYYNAQEMPATQYSNRKQQLVCSTLEHIHPGDCGSSVLVPFMFTEKTARHVIGKKIVHKGHLLELTDQNVMEFCNKTIHMRSVMTCLWTDGYCETCGGGLTRFLPKHVNPGITAAIEVMSVAAQMVLSSKHLQKTNASDYDIPEEFLGYFYCLHNEIFMSSSRKKDNLALCIPYQSVDKLPDLEYVIGDQINDQYFSSLTGAAIVSCEDFDTPLVPMTPLEDRNKVRPYLSADILMMIRKHPECLESRGNNVYIKLDQFDFTKPIMRCVVVNDSTRQFVRRIERMFNNHIVNYSTCEDALREFTKVIWERTSPNIMHLETMLRAFMITSPTNYEIPVVCSQDDVMFSQLSRIIPRRSIGTQLAFEQWAMYISDPSTYIFPKLESGVFDEYLGYND